jgi:hypothetical protein
MNIFCKLSPTKYPNALSYKSPFLPKTSFIKDLPSFRSWTPTTILPKYQQNFAPRSHIFVVSEIPAESPQKGLIQSDIHYLMDIGKISQAEAIIDEMYRKGDVMEERVYARILSILGRRKYVQCQRSKYDCGYHNPSCA